MKRAALFSKSGLYRYRLSRVWDPHGPVGAWIMLNPSTADATADDPTIRRVISFARLWGWGGVQVYNLFALRSTKPSALLGHPDPVGPRNDAHVTKASDSITVVAAWGEGGGLLGRADSVRRLLMKTGVELQCLGTNKGGSPKHPLYVQQCVALRAYD